MLHLFIYFLIATLGSSVEWSQQDADASHSASLNVNGIPPSERIIKVPDNARYACKLSVNGLVLTSAGSLLASTFCTTDAATVFPLMFSLDLSKSDPPGWIQTILLNNGWPISQMLVNADGSFGIFQTHGNFTQVPQYISLQDGQLWPTKVDIYRRSRGPMVLCPHTESTFLVQDDDTIDSVSPDQRELLPTGAYFDNFENPRSLGNPNYNFALDPTGLRVTSVGLAGVDTPHGRYNVHSKFIVWDVLKNSSGVSLSESWSYSFPKPETFATPAFSRDGRLFLFHSIRAASKVVLDIFDGKTGRRLPSFRSEIDYFDFQLRSSLAITADGRYALLKGMSTLLVVRTNDGAMTRFDDAQKMITTIDDDSSVVYAVNR